MTTDRDREIDRLISERDIRNLIARVAHLADDGNFEDYLSLWAEEASWGAVGGEPFSGHEALRIRWDGHEASLTQGQGSNSRHLNTTLWVTFDDDDQARAQSYFLYLRDASEQPPTVEITGRYDDVFRRTEKGWQFVSRRINRNVN